MLVGGSKFLLQKLSKGKQTQLVGLCVSSVNFKDHIVDFHLNNDVNSRLRWTFKCEMKGAVYGWENAAAGCTFCKKHDLTGVINFRCLDCLLR